MSLLKSPRASSAAKGKTKGGTTPPLVETLNPIPGLIAEFLKNQKLIVPSPDGKTEYLFWPTTSKDSKVIAAWRFTGKDYQGYSHYEGEPVYGWINGNTWSNTYRYSGPEGCDCATCVALYGTVDKKHATAKAQEYTLSGLLGIIFTGVQLWKFQCGMYVRVDGPSHNLLNYF